MPEDTTSGTDSTETADKILAAQNDLIQLGKAEHSGDCFTQEEETEAADIRLAVDGILVVLRGKYSACGIPGLSGWLLRSLVVKPLFSTTRKSDFDVTMIISIKCAYFAPL